MGGGIHHYITTPPPHTLSPPPPTEVPGVRSLGERRRRRPPSLGLWTEQPPRDGRRGPSVDTTLASGASGPAGERGVTWGGKAHEKKLVHIKATVE